MTDTEIEYFRYQTDASLSDAPPLLGQRPVSISMLISTWSGSRQGLGVETVQPPVAMTNGPTYDGYYVDYIYPPDGYVICNPRYRQVTAKEVAVSNGRLRDRDVVIGPLVYPYSVELGGMTATGGFDPLLWAPPIVPTMDGPYFLLQGPDFPVNGVRYKLLNTQTQRTVTYKLYMRAVDAI